MANTYTQIHIPAIFAVQNRKCLIHKEWKNDLFKYMNGIIQKRGHKVLAINGVSDHVHLFFGQRPDQSLSDLIKEIKLGSMNWINNSGYLNSKFYWQDGYGAFSYSKSHVGNVIRYIGNQEQHHAEKTFLQEYTFMLEKYEIPNDERYLFKPII